MASRAIPREEMAGLALAVVLHAALLALLVLKPASAPLVPPPERISVTLSEELAPTSTSPELQAEAAPAAAPKIAPKAEPEPAPEPVPAPQPKPLPRIKPEPVVMPAPQPRAVPKLVPRPLPRPQPRVTPTQVPRAVVRPQPAPAPRAAAKPQPAPRAATRPASASRISNDFLKGVPAAQAAGPARNPPAATIGPAVRSALLSAVSRELKPRWAAPQGAEADKLVTFVTWNLNRDGSLGGTPRVVRQDGITDANRAQAARHAEQAVRAIQLAAPFELPADYYEAWKRVVEFRFDRKLSQ